jgi:hypothetical protein
MDERTELMIAAAARAPRWEDEEQGSNDLETLRAEFRRRLYATPPEERGREECNGGPPEGR